MAADHPGIVLGLDHAFARHRHLARARRQADQGDVVEMLVVILELGMGVLQPHLPIDDPLPLRLLRRQPQPLERVHHRFAESVMRGVPDLEFELAHAWNR